MWFIYLIVSLKLVFLYQMFFPRKIVNISPALGKWTVITGATDGIGKSFAYELAEMGFNVILVSRSVDKLEATSKEIEEKFNVSTKIIQADFTSLHEDMYAEIESTLEGVEIGILVNNVAMNFSYPEYFLEIGKLHPNFYQNILNCNISSAVHMTRFALPGMVKRGKGLIINISSGLSTTPSPLLTLYGATKSFLTKFSQDLNTEYKDKGVHIHVLTTGLVATKFSGAKERSFNPPSHQIYVKSALEDVTRWTCCTGYISHTIIAAFNSILKVSFPEYLATRALKSFTNIKTLAQTKRQESQAKVSMNTFLKT